MPTRTRRSTTCSAAASSLRPGPGSEARKKGTAKNGETPTGPAANSSPHVIGHLPAGITPRRHFLRRAISGMVGLVGQQQAIPHDLALKGLARHLEAAQHGPPAIDRHFLCEQAARDLVVAGLLA